MAHAAFNDLGSETDDVSVMEQAILLASQPSSRHAVSDIVQRGLKRACARNAIHVLQYVLEHGPDVEKLIAKDILINDEPTKPSQEVLEILVAHGWDINSRGDSWPLLWFVVEYPDLVEWCLDHGAKVDVPDDLSRGSSPPPTILGLAASSGSVETFELLRRRGAPLDRRTLHLAVEKATLLASRGTSQPYTDRMAMVRHLIDVVKLDVNAIEHRVGDQCSTPLCYLARRPNSDSHRELINFLLDRGADPEMDCGTEGGIDWPRPIDCAESCGNLEFLHAVQEWRGRQQGDGSSESI
ncbi:uncharacterized protein MYCFIDRAFT_78768 [Pseudocercospora fijiensis CIRAD86]|uniref:Ankyrin repeat protein n=1 Tax=Pseudocercospora fijiensis (strain CIRAD86) TaxID=383855 RepID=M2YVT3_PSEFD|nr:uncharacterized protein MYCFIDRAFT_78768 [Pseudocercospora fijiensis CIRAD86]EME81800.1 hypothetical protein MYCFIDRAFT_78768 [Pseudocercospora fijiensis CIRAD86]